MTEDILSTESEVLDFLRDEFQSIIQNEIIQEAVRGHLELATQTERYNRILEKLQKIIS